MREEAKRVGGGGERRDRWRRCPRLMAARVHQPGIYEWPQVCGGERGMGGGSITSERCHSGSGALRLRGRR